MTGLQRQIYAYSRFFLLWLFYLYDSIFVHCEATLEYMHWKLIISILLY